MPEILLTPEMLREESNKLNSQRENLNSTVEAIKNLVDSLEAGWKGKAQDAFVESFRAKKAIYDAFSQDMLGFATFMTSYAAAMEQRDASAPGELTF